MIGTCTPAVDFIKTWFLITTCFSQVKLNTFRSSSMDKPVYIHMNYTQI